MSKKQITSFSDIDFVSVDASQDEFVLPSGDVYRFSDHMCDSCWTAGTVLQSNQKKPHYFCVLCNNDLEFVKFTNDFLEPTGDKLQFLLPKKWADADRKAWYQDFKDRRLAQEEIRKNIMSDGKE